MGEGFFGSRWVDMTDEWEDLFLVGFEGNEFLRVNSLDDAGRCFEDFFLDVVSDRRFVQFCQFGKFPDGDDGHRSSGKGEIVKSVWASPVLIREG